MSEDRQRMYRALVAYQDDGLGVEEAAALYGVNPHTMRSRMRAQGWRMRTWKQTGKRRHGNASRIPPEAAHESRAGTPTWMLAQRHGVSVRRMQEWLREQGVDARTQFTTRNAIRQSEAARQRVEQILALREQGYTYGQIAIKTGLARGYVSAAISRHARGLYRWQRETTTPKGTP